ncbi:Tn7 transposase TnsA N-terminal domain-containing protein [Ferrovibrio xuzhouensis]|uniref:Tn7 transposase TnsA N-terminal domain-containing protein n=1 Tax=Ferrovibrio xuzhouensis TaxID=1576914 RepID=A0ABV7VJP5_9PROT
MVRIIGRKSASEVRAATVKRYPYLAFDMARKVGTRRKRRVMGKFVSVKNGGMMPWESSLELDMFRLLEVDNNVIAYRPQPERLIYDNGERVRLHYPDIEVTFLAGKTQIVEVKEADDANDPVNQKEFAIRSFLYAKEGLEYVVRDRDWVHQGVALANARQILLFNDMRPAPLLRKKVLELFDVEPPKTLADLHEALKMPLADRGLLLNMAMRNIFTIDTHSAPLSDRSAVSPRKERAKP